MIKAQTPGADWLHLEFPFPCQVHWCKPREHLDQAAFRVLLHHSEPKAYLWPSDLVRTHHKAFHLILTNDRTLLDLPNARFMVFGSRWTRAVPRQKRFELSFLYSTGGASEGVLKGYRLRRDLWKRRAEIRIPIGFYTSVLRPPKGISDPYPLPAGDRDLLYDAMFTVVIENNSEPDYFTEKLVDPLSTFTRPLYVGAPNIRDYFDADAMICCTDVDDLIEVANRLTSADYWGAIPAMQASYEASKEYWDWGKRLEQEIAGCFLRFKAQLSGASP
jgi:hypothetical protein